MSWSVWLMSLVAQTIGLALNVVTHRKKKKNSSLVLKNVIAITYTYRGVCSLSNSKRCVCFVAKSWMHIHIGVKLWLLLAKDETWAKRYKMKQDNSLRLWIMFKICIILHDKIRKKKERKWIRKPTIMGAMIMNSTLSISVTEWVDLIPTIKTGRVHLNSHKGNLCGLVSVPLQEVKGA